MQIQSLTGAALALAVAGAWIAACSPKNSLPFPDVASFCKARATAECQVASTCGVDADECQTARVAACNEDATMAMASGTREYVQGNAQACIDVLNASNAYGGGSSKILFAQLVGKGSITDVCGRVFSGTVAENKPCQSSYECVNGNICAVVPGSTASVCEPQVQKNMGDQCANAGETCATDSYCAMPTGGGVFQCVASKQEGQACDATTPCISTERCTATQTCEARVGANRPCTTNDDCEPTAPYCDPLVGNKCAPGLSFANGAPDCSPYRAGGALPVVTGVDSGPQQGD